MSGASMRREAEMRLWRKSLLGEVLRDISKTLNFSAKNRTMCVETPSESLHSLVAVEGLLCGRKILKYTCEIYACVGED